MGEPERERQQETERQSRRARENDTRSGPVLPLALGDDGDEDDEEQQEEEDDNERRPHTNALLRHSGSGQQTRGTSERDLCASAKRDRERSCRHRRTR